MSPHRSIDREARTRRFEIKIQTSRGIVFTGGVLLAIAARLLGVAEYSWSAVCLFFFAANGTAVAFAAAAAKDKRHLAGIPACWLWIGLDIGLFTWVVAVTGGSASIWFPWALTNVAAAAYVIGKRGALLVMAGNLAAYLALVAVAEAEVEGALARVVVRMLILYAAGFFAVKGVCKLRARSLRLSNLHAQEGQRAAEQQQMARTIDEQSEQLDRLSDELRKVALIDPQTGTHNRRYLKQRIREDLAMIRRTHIAGQPGLYLGFVLLNLDHFRRVNDEHGHEGGDEVLRQVSAVLAETVREMDTVIRWDSDTFLILLRHISSTNLSEVVERMIRGIRSRGFVIAQGEQTSLTCSAGFCHYPFGDAERFTWEEVVKLAANALSLAKERGRDRWIGLSEGRRSFDRVGARLAVEDLAAAEQREYIRVLQAG